MSAADLRSPSIRHAMGLDVGTARTKVAFGHVADVEPSHLQVLPTALVTGHRGSRSGEGAYAVAHEHGTRLHHGHEICAPGGAALLGRFLGGLLSGPDSVAPVHPLATSLVIAVPDARLSGADADGLRAVLVEQLGFADARLVSEMLCVAARVAAPGDGAPRVRLLCDVGAGSVTAAICAFDDTTVRLLDVESTQLAAEATVEAVLLDRLRPASPQERLHLARFLHEARAKHSHRAQLVLQRLTSRPEYAETPVYFLPDHRTVTGRDLADALVAVAQAAADVVDRLRVRTASLVGELGHDLVVTGGTALPPVVERLRSAARAEATITIDPSGAACGAQRIAAGRIAAADGYPHRLGLAVRRIRDGLLESATLEIAGPGPLAGPVTLIVEPEEELVVRWKPNDQGDWEVVRPAIPVHVPPGTYRVETRPRRSGAATLLLHSDHGGRTVAVELPAAAGARRP